VCWDVPPICRRISELYLISNTWYVEIIIDVPRCVDNDSEIHEIKLARRAKDDRNASARTFSRLCHY